MMTNSRGGSLCALAGLAFGLAGCQSILPGDGPSRLALRQAPVVASSGQKLGPDGYPLLGAFPNSAAPQIDDASVQAARGGLETAATSQNATAASANASYQAKLAEMQAIKTQQSKDVAAALAPPPAGTSAKPAADDPAAVLREIEGRR
ncbi:MULTISPECIES: hypothetical protein [unclassified Aureimonas]|uniref:hypothetical protein n=1 Tax=unclassified Aureimonas TaxID=2615206 RepID=UPI000ADD327C|nr:MULTISPECIES: hypothetical protein [unclassified Aureimonas]